MSRTVSWLTRHNKARSIKERVLYVAPLIKAVALALHDFPELNATWQEGTVVPKPAINVGVAISLRGGGLVAPALHRQAHRLAPGSYGQPFCRPPGHRRAPRQPVPRRGRPPASGPEGAMNDQEILSVLLRILQEMVPEEDVTKLKPDVRVRDQIDLDSMDVVNFLIAVDAELGVETPEKDYPKLATLDGCVTYFSAKLARKK
jgi:acyl carrier protein